MASNGQNIRLINNYTNDQCAVYGSHYCMNNAWHSEVTGYTGTKSLKDMQISFKEAPPGTNLIYNGKFGLAPSCTDGAVDGDESDIDCGGSCPDHCTGGRYCNNNADCESSRCIPTTGIGSAYGTCISEIPIAHCTSTPPYPQINSVVHFEAYADYDTGTPPYVYSWDFKDNTPLGSGKSITHSFTATKTYDVNITVTDNKNRKGTAVCLVTTTAAPP